jgi:DNA-directed RNA polymerase IV subunit 1
LVGIIRNYQTEKSLRAPMQTWGEGVQNLYVALRNPFIEGLNPLECLLHAISGAPIYFLKMPLSLGH